jgi:O-antigen/teichoic acid export membrane protein
MQNIHNITIHKQLEIFWRKSLYRNSFYLILGNITSALLGFSFWAVAARYYSASDVGMASAVISAMPLIAILGALGLQIGLIRFLPDSQDSANELINTSLTLSTIVSILVSIGFVLTINVLSPDLIFLKNNTILFILFVCFTTATSLSLLVDNIFIAERRSSYTTTRNIIFSLLKLILIVLLALFANSYGILNSWGISLLFSVGIGMFLFLPRIRHHYFPYPVFKFQKIAGLIRYSLLNNVAIFISNITIRILPLFILSSIGPEEGAYYYIAWIISNTISLIPMAISNSLLAEGSHNENKVMSDTIRSLGLSMIILIPIIIIVMVFANNILYLLGAGYAQHSAGLLRLFMISLFPGSIYLIYSSTLRVRKGIITLIAFGIVNAGVTMILSYLLVPNMGISGAGIGYLISQLIIALWIIIKEGWIKSLYKGLTSTIHVEKS